MYLIGSGFSCIAITDDTRDHKIRAFNSILIPDRGVAQLYLLELHLG